MTSDCVLEHLLLLLHHGLDGSSVGQPESEARRHWHLLTWLALVIDLIRDIHPVRHVSSWHTGRMVRMNLLMLVRNELWMLMIVTC
jgi:hypothetical protein